jgi:broad specificity phosphatase PhoE
MIQNLYLIRHGETAWSLSGQHTGLSDIPLTPGGIQEGKQLHQELEHIKFDHIFTSPLQRAKETCRLAGFLDQAKIDPTIVEWNYGKYDGLTSKEIALHNPHWSLFAHGAPGGESVHQIQERADRVLSHLFSLSGSCVLFSHGHFLRVLTARWLALPASEGRLFYLAPAGISHLGTESGNRVILSWNTPCLLR